MRLKFLSLNIVGLRGLHFKISSLAAEEKMAVHFAGEKFKIRGSQFFIKRLDEPLRLLRGNVAGRIIFENLAPRGYEVAAENFLSVF